jgi:hypothetical protein
MSRTLLLVFVLSVVGLGLFAGFGALASLLANQSQEMTYTTIEGECQIRVYDDPLYAEHWAKEVNPYNCQSYLTQEKANSIKADTRQTNIKTNNMVMAVYSIFGVVGITLVLIVMAIIRG